jgi:transposase
MAPSYSIGKHFEEMIEGLLESGRYRRPARSCAKGCGLLKSARSVAR